MRTICLSAFIKEWEQVVTNYRTPKSSPPITPSKQTHSSCQISSIKGMYDPIGSQKKKESALISLKNKTFISLIPICTKKINLTSGLKCVFSLVCRVYRCTDLIHPQYHMMKCATLAKLWNRLANLSFS